ncbi:EAL domain-containing protein [Vibrio sp. V27_P1S3P104]|nr:MULTISPECIES: EAL domain-containing protein [unclassified Vibrio]NAW70629.1 EAL domain-containing protein [Vibrio sp. V28_P6S34P95]NAX05102.1 EAL domain-containing protein [Vibrio sp. V30_P3S12P165]NAX35559.1 EAL domain-containing protein [Vibrio sp. V29_P1S30P107]NAX36858.1 EAL domain-containing protein [Vibrio sp. V27_P1S3P104]NNN44309.1 EAL domain-containing protein [Vibrio sp. 1-1(7)]
MANLTSAQAIYLHLCKLMKQNITTDDDKIVYDAFINQDIRHACQAIRQAHSGEVEFQHLTLRFGYSGEQSVYHFDLSETMVLCLDLYSLYLAIRQAQFQMETFHPDLISNVVVPIRISALLWESGTRYLNQAIEHHAKAFKHIIPSIQLDSTAYHSDHCAELIEKLRENAFLLWIEVSTNQPDLDRIHAFKPDMIKLVVNLEDKTHREAFLPIARFLRKYRYTWVASRVANQNELNHYRLLGASYYFGYFSDIPSSVSFKAPTLE